MMWILGWIVPGGLILSFALALVHGLGPEGFIDVWGGGPPKIVLGVVVLLAGYFHRSRVVLFALGLVGVQAVFSLGGGDAVGIFLLGALLSFGAGLLAFSKDRGVLSAPGLIQLGAFGLMFGMGWLLLRLAPEDMASLLARTPFPGRFSDWSGLPQLVLLPFLFSIPVSLIVALVRNGPVERAWVWSLLMLGLALHFSSIPGSVDLFLVGAGLILGLSLMETSYAMAYKDDLTGLPARRALMRDLSSLGGTYSAAMVDVDLFKKFNDRYGHDVGDQVLRMVAARLGKAKGGGKAYRYGGEEFTLLYPGRSLQEALPHLKEVRRSVEGATFTLRSWRRPRKKPVDPGSWRKGRKERTRLLSVTVSIGVADSGGNDPSPESVLKKADRALYRAKKGGRNRVAK
jgi:GGDEF domain-containing protein